MSHTRAECVHSFIVHCLNLTAYKIKKSTVLLAIIVHVRTWILQTTFNTSLGGTALLFIKSKIKIYFQTSDFGLFHTLHFFLQKKIKLYNCINIKFFHHENG